MESVTSLDMLQKRDDRHLAGGDWTELVREDKKRIALDKTAREQRLRQIDEHFHQRANEERLRHPDAGGEFTPANDADYKADVKQIQHDYEQRLAEVNEFEKQAHPWSAEHPADELRRMAKLLRDNGMKSAYKRHDMRKGNWNDLAAFHKRQLAIYRHEKSLQGGDLTPGMSHPNDDIIKFHERAYARARPMPPIEQQVAGFPPPPAPPPSPPSSPRQLALLPAFENRVVRAARSSLHQLEHAAHSVRPAFFGWEKRAFKSHPPGVQKVGPLNAELEATSSW
ncbi:MAG: hypothetical protein M1826_007084 [Phylliscum demangeonii]|nr:MAG: hypothetical protein M1826_007084 [Phylliscum demangeonii]